MYCLECKEYILEDENIVKENNKYYHLFCYLLRFGIILPIDEEFIE